MTAKFLKATNEFHIEREKEFRQVYTTSLIQIYDIYDEIIKQLETNYNNMDDRIKKIKEQQNKLHEYVVKLELLDIKVKQK